MPTANFGEVVFVFENSIFRVGDKVYFKSSHELVQMENMQVLVMEEDNIVGIKIE